MDYSEGIKNLMATYLSMMKQAVEQKSYSDKTFKAQIISSVRPQEFTVRYCGNIYTVSSSIVCNVGDTVRVCAPCNNWNDLYVVENKSHGKNTGEIPDVTTTDIANWNDAYGKRHVHGNKTVLDKITQALLDKWDGVTNKVDKVPGKQLSANDYTDSDKGKLAGISTGAEVNIQSDWRVTDVGSDAYIKNKPVSMPASDVSAWAKSVTKPSYGWAEIDGKPSTFPSSSHTHSYSSLVDRPTGLDGGYVRTGQQSGTTIGDKATAEGRDTVSSGGLSHAEGERSTASGYASHAEGERTIASGACSHAEGTGAVASGVSSHAEGDGTRSSGSNSHAEGDGTVASGRSSHAGGTGTEARGKCQMAIGSYNALTGSANSLESVFVVGTGNSNSNRKNMFRVSTSGIYGARAFTSSGADYGEYFEWQDGNIKSADRIGYFVTLDKDKIKLASSEDYVLGAISGTAVVVGNGYEDQWSGMEMLDEWGRPIWEEYADPDDPEVKRKRIKINPDYSPNEPYISRTKRSEWDVVGMLGVLIVRDDGTCRENGWCKVTDGGIATASDDGYRVLKRVSDNIIKILFK